MDRNCYLDNIEITEANVALRKESVDRNTKCTQTLEGTLIVALRKESVDRNLAVWAVEHAYQRRSPQGERG